jgi:hypothetical protein
MGFFAAEVVSGRGVMPSCQRAASHPKHWLARALLLDALFYQDKGRFS